MVILLLFLYNFVFDVIKFKFSLVWTILGAALLKG
jgi:hypothetical protein